MANPHSLMWRAPGCRNAEREKFRRLMKKVEAVRIRHGMTKREVCAEIGKAEVAAGASVGKLPYGRLIKE